MSRKTSLALLAVIILAGFFLRLYRLDAVAFRGDEAFSVQRWAATPLSESLTEIAAIEPHPPLTYALFRVWGLIFGTNSEFSLRMLPVLFNLIGIPALYAIGKILSGRRDIALLSAFFWAIHPFQIWHSQDFRNYAVWAGLSTMTLWLGLRIIWSNKRTLIDWSLYTTVALIACLIFYNELLTIGILGLFVLIFYWRDRRFVLQWSFLNAAIIAITFLAFFIFQGDLITGGGYGGTTGGFELSQYWRRFLPVLAFGDTLSLTLIQQFNPFTVWWTPVFTLIALTWLTVVYYQRKNGYFLALLGFLPLLMLGLISMRLSIFRPRYVMIASPAYILMISSAIVLLWRHVGVQHVAPEKTPTSFLKSFQFVDRDGGSIHKIISIALFLIWLALSILSLNNYYHNPAYNKAPDWTTLAHYLEVNTTSDEIIIQTGADASFGYYYDRAEILAGQTGLPADVIQPIPEIITAMEQIAEDYHSIWIVGQTFPDWQNSGIVEKWAFDNLELVRETRIAGLPVRQFMAWDVLATEIEDEPLAIYGESIELLGTQIFEPEPTDELTIWLYWQPLTPTDVPHTVFVHLIGGISPETNTPLWSQDDHPPLNGIVNTVEWQTDKIYRDIFRLPLENVPAGNYQIMIGFYNPENGERLLLEDGTDAFSIDIVIAEN